MPKVSVIVPVYHVEPYIERCARSLFEQTLDDIEYIFVNDSTPDKSMKVLARVIDDYPARKGQIRIVDMPSNSGLAAVRKVGIQSASGDYIIHCDSDDWVDRTMYEQMWKKAVAEDLEMVICGYFTTDGDHVESVDHNDYHGFKSIRHAIMADGVKNFLWNKMVSHDIYGFIDEWPVKNYWEDAAIVSQLVFHCKSIGKIDSPLYYYFQNNCGICLSASLMQKLTSQEENINIAVRHIMAYGGWIEFKKELTHRKCKIKTDLWQWPWRDYLRFLPEVNIPLFFDPYLPINKKLGHLSKCLGVHGIFRK